MERSFHDPSFEHEALWTVTITAACPKCKCEMEFGSIEGGGSIMKCNRCDFEIIDKEKTVNEIADAVLKRVTGGKPLDLAKVQEDAVVETEIQMQEHEGKSE
jgi:hypothetical protein